MPSVTIYRPGRDLGQESSSGWWGWQFEAEVDGKVGLVATYSPNPQSEEQAAAWCLRQLQQHPETLDGILFADDPGGDDGDLGGDDGVASEGGDGAIEGDIEDQDELAKHQEEFPS